MPSSKNKSGIANQNPTSTASTALASISIRVAATDSPGMSCDESGVFALQVLGDDMLPEFEHGDIIVVEPDGLLAEGAYVVARCGDSWLLRQLGRDARGWTLHALAPAADEDVADATVEERNIRGVVIQKSKPGRRRSIKRYAP